MVVAGANGRVGSRVVTELLRKHSKVHVRLGLGLGLGLERPHVDLAVLAEELSDHPRADAAVGPGDDHRGQLTELG